MAITLDAAALNLGVAVVCGALIGSERQVRQRMAGLRTNALVALGAAGFVVFSLLVPHEVSPTRVAAQVVSGIGFLGAGIIFRDGFNVHGLNTAATLWCSAALGLMAGFGAWPYAILMTAMVIFINLGLRPLVRFIKRKTNAGVPLARHYRVSLNGRAEQEADLRSFMLRTFSMGGLHLSEIDAEPVEGGSTVELSAIVIGDGGTDAALEQSVARLAAEPGLRHVRWQVLDEG